MESLANPAHPLPVADPWRWGAWIREQLTGAEDTGYFGPGSAIWRLHSEAVLGLGLGRAVLMQLAHLWVAQAVADHSTYSNRPINRLVTTVSAGELMIFGSRQQADIISTRIRTVHTHINGILHDDVGRWRRGTPYSAEDPEALLWVLMTLVDTAIVVYEACFRRLSDRFVKAYLADAARLGALLGVHIEDVPTDREALAQYMRQQVADGAVAVSETGKRMAAMILEPSLSGVLGITYLPYRAGARALAVTLLPADLRQQFGPVVHVRGAALYGLAGRLGRIALRRLPPRVRYDPIAATALHRRDNVA